MINNVIFFVKWRKKYQRNLNEIWLSNLFYCKYKNIFSPALFIVNQHINTPTQITYSQMADTQIADPATESLVGKEQNITADGGLIKKIIKEGEGWQTPAKGADVTGVLKGVDNSL